MRLGLTLKADYVSLHPDLNETSLHMMTKGLLII